MNQNGALLVHKPTDITSFGVVDQIKKALSKSRGISKKNLPKVGHGGTLDPFATGLLVILIGRASKLARYFLGADKQYQGVIRFGETTVPGDPTSEISERTDVLPSDLESIQKTAHQLTQQAYHQVPPMHSAKKVNGKPLYKLAHRGIEIEREPKICYLRRFEVSSYTPPDAKFHLSCSSGTYVRTLAQDLGRLLGSVAYLTQLERTASGSFESHSATPLEEILTQIHEGIELNQLESWIPFDRLLEGYHSAEASYDETQLILQGRQNTLFQVIRRAQQKKPNLHEDTKNPVVAVYHRHKLVAIASNESNLWKIDKVFG